MWEKLCAAPAQALCLWSVWILCFEHTDPKHPTNSADAHNHRVWLRFIGLCGCVWVCVAYRCLNTHFLLDGEFHILSAAFKWKCFTEINESDSYCLLSCVCVTHPNLPLCLTSFKAWAWDSAASQTRLHENRQRSRPGVSLCRPSVRLFVSLSVRLSWHVSVRRSLKDSREDAVSQHHMEREMLVEKEFQRVSISGEEKCGVRNTLHTELQLVVWKHDNNEWEFTALINLC